jgi:hypothetical protein
MLRGVLGLWQQLLMTSQAARPCFLLHYCTLPTAARHHDLLHGCAGRLQLCTQARTWVLAWLEAEGVCCAKQAYSTLLLHIHPTFAISLCLSCWVS